MSSDFEPRLLLPGTPGIPSHMRVSHDVSVFNELADRSVSAAIWVPRWSKPVQEAFNRIAGQKPDKSRSCNDIFFPNDGNRIAAGGFLAQGVRRWLEPVLSQQSREDARVIVDEVVDCQQAFLRMHPNTRRCVSTLSVFSADDVGVDVFSQPPIDSAAHMDPFDRGLFASPVGTILVDQDGLDRSLMQKYELPVAYCAGRLWQVSDSSFLFMRGRSSDNFQLHFVPPVPGDLMRYRLFAQPC